MMPACLTSIKWTALNEEGQRVEYSCELPFPAMSSIVYMRIVPELDDLVGVDAYELDRPVSP